MPASAPDHAVVRRLIVSQFPHWSDPPLAPVASAGTDNALWRLGADMVVRLPTADWAAEQAAKEQAWLPRLAPHLPLPIPTPVASGEPGEGYPRRWSICRWIEGADAVATPIEDLANAATDLGGFIAALQRIDSDGGPPSGAQNSHRGVPLVGLDRVVRKALSALGEEVDTAALSRFWDQALAAPAWDGPPVWLHGDLHPGNLLVREGRLAAVIDFGLLGVGDPACDLMAGWSVLTRATRPAFRAAVRPDDATWTRGRGWALYAGVVALAYYLESNPTLAAITRRTLGEVLADA